ncbi:uncharacterized protein LOC129911690 [Episyrphus balteatus]|uniref:uncharacterized protein LOC129911690 n=1 Tax=Episyrphus balteatus TaxID=286459 RepID=UPI0024867ED4|nr:uncharacterized protein LOC129911690 [Episyrphus balteatus]
MDDLLTGCYEEDDLQRLQLDISNVLSESGFHLRKWASNSPTVINSIPIDQREVMQSLKFDETDGVRTLGLQWVPSLDHLSFAVQVNEIPNTILTKRILLSDSCKLFDPLGLLSPSTIIPKMIFQSLWRPKVDWDETVPHDIKRKWLHYRDHITCLAAIKVPRWVGTGIPEATTDLHGFADASQSAYAAAVYVRTVAPNGSISVSLLTAKTRVAPLKTTTLSLPRLELCGAFLLAQLMKHVKVCLSPHVRKVYGWTDSTVALAWIRQEPGKWTTFVANRVSEIQQIVPAENWFHVQSSQNPADCATRGVFPHQLSEHPLWWSGPTWLREDESAWPAQHIFTTKLDQRSESANLVTAPPPIWDLINQYSSLRKLKRITGYILRYIAQIRRHVKLRKEEEERKRLQLLGLSNAVETSEDETSTPPHKSSRHLHLSELSSALDFWIHQTQKHFFPDEIHRLQSNKPVGKCSKLLKLHPFLDQNHLIRVGGRLSNSRLTTDKKYPLVLPANSRLALLLCEDIHSSTLHAGPQTMLATLQSRYWVIRARQLVRKVYKSCIKCSRYTAVVQQQLMGDLPWPRVQICRPFLRSAVDFAGPVQLRFSKGRGSRAVKGYISIFVCMSTGAMHLELASDLSSATFIAVFKRFVSRRGHCKELFSDNGTNFVGAEKELKMFLSLAMKDEHLAKHLSDDGTVWHFNPPSAPHMGGYWETAVKRVKFHLRRTLGDTLLTYEEFTTLLTEIEACVNSRPLCATTSDVDDLSALTPGHFLIGEPLKTIPEPNVNEFKGNLMSRWQIISSLRQHFWKRWSLEYLVQLQQRAKWNRPSIKFNVGDLVLLRDEKLPPTKWKLGRIIRLHPGHDDLVRVVTIKTADGVLMRPVVKVSPLLSFIDDKPNN